MLGGAAAAALIALPGGAMTAGSAQAALPRPGLWVGTKGNVQLSFTVRASGASRTVTDVTVFCGQYGSVYASASDDRPAAFGVQRDGTIRRWPQEDDRVARIGATSAVLDSPTITSGSPGVDCPVSDFRRVTMRRGDFRPIQDGTYSGESAAYRFRFTVAGGGTLVDDLVGHAGVPDSSTLTGYCGPGGAIGGPARIGADGSFTIDDGPGRDSRLVVRGTVGTANAGGSYTYTADSRCVGDGALTGTVDWAAGLTAAAPGAAPTGQGGGADDPRPLPDGPGTAPDPVPAPGDGYSGPPTESRAAGCSATVSSGPIAAIAACFRTRGTRAVSSGRVRLNGIDLTPARPGVAIAIDRRTRAITSTGPVELRVGSLSLLRAALDWRRPDAVFEVSGSSRGSGRRPGFRTGGQGLFGLPVKGSAKLRLAGGRTKLTVTLTLPRAPGQLRRLAGYSGELTAAADNEHGLVLDGAKLAFPGMRFGFVEIQSAKLAVAQVGDSYHFDGGATVFPFRIGRIGFSGALGFGVGDGYFKLGAAVEQLNRALVYGFFLQKVGFEAQADPFGIGGSAGVTFGPQFRLGGGLVSAARLDGSLAYLSGGGDDPSSLRLAGALELAEAKAADGSVEVRGDGSVTAAGTFALKVGGYGLDGGLDGWFDGARAFEVEGRARLSLPGPDGAGDAILSSTGVGACRHGVGPDVGFGYRWGAGLSGITFAAGSCSLGAWRAERATAAGASGTARAAAGPLSVAVPRGRRQLALQIAGEGAAPAVAVVAPDGRRIEPTAAPGGEFADATTLLVQDPDTRATYLVVDRPRAGRWRVEPLPGSAPVAALRTALPLPRGARERSRARARRAPPADLPRDRARRPAAPARRGRRRRAPGAENGARRPRAGALHAAAGGRAPSRRGARHRARGNADRHADARGDLHRRSLAPGGAAAGAGRAAGQHAGRHVARRAGARLRRRRADLRRAAAAVAAARSPPRGPRRARPARRAGARDGAGVRRRRPRQPSRERSRLSGVTARSGAASPTVRAVTGRTAAFRRFGGG